MTENQPELERPKNPFDKLNILQIVLAICLAPYAGTIMYFLYKGDSPKKAKQACHITLWVLGISFVFNILIAIVVGSL